MLGDLEGVKIKFGKTNAEKAVTEIHEVDEILLVLSGELLVTIEDTEHTMKPGDCAFIPSDTEHHVRSDDEVIYLVARKRDD